MMEELNNILCKLTVSTQKITQESVQEILLYTKKNYKSPEYKESWERVASSLWHHLEVGLDRYDDQLLCATCLFSVISLLDTYDCYLSKIQKIIINEITSRQDSHTENLRTSYAVSLVYGIFQSSFLVQAADNVTDTSSVAHLLQTSFDMLSEMAFEYSKFTFIVFKSLSLFKKVGDTKYAKLLFTNTNQIKLLRVTNNNWENPISGVRDLNKIIFQTLILTLDVNMYSEIMKELNNFYWNKAKYLMIAEIVNHNFYTSIGDGRKGNYLEGLLNSLYKPGLVSAGADMYFAILKTMNTQEAWSNLFLEAIIKILSGPSNKAKDNFTNYWLLTTLKTYPMLAGLLLNELNHLADSAEKLYSCLSIMKQANKLGLLSKYMEPTDCIFKNRIILHGLVHGNNKIRMMAFEVVCVSQNKNLPSKDEYDLVLNFLHDNVNSDCTVLRISMLNSVSTFITQLHESYLNNIGNSHYFNSLKRFCYDFQDVIIKSLQIEGNYQRKITSVKLANSLLDKLIELPRKKQKTRKIKEKTLLQTLVDDKEWWLLDRKHVIESFIKLLKDPADDVRENVLKLLLQHYSTNLRQKDVFNSMIHEALNSMKSKFFYDISCGQTIFKLIICLLLQEQVPQATFKNVEDIFNFATNELIREYKQNRSVIETIDMGKQLHSYMTILYGVLEVCLEKEYRLSISDSVVMELLDILEGTSNQFAWEQETSTSSDFSKMSDMIQDIIMKSGYDIMCDTNEQAKITGLEKIVLMCLWLNVKASCDLSSLLIKYQRKDTQIGICQKALDIISHVLETCRHKGAIEAAGVALGKSIQHLTSLPEGSKISKIPFLFLECKLKELISEANRMASVTRRGAGLSIMVHRIVSSDVKKGKPLFHYFMRTILHTCNNTGDIPAMMEKVADIDNEKDLPKAIYIHFLTRIVTDSSLASDVMFYSVELAELAFSNLTNPHWQIRNAALQLYGALIQKLIGQKKASGSDDEIMATVACDELRTHSPKLWNYVLCKLDTNDYEDKIQHHSNLVPILNMLASLAPRYIFSYHIENFKQEDEKLLYNLTMLLSSPIYTVRRLAAQAISNIYPFESIYTNLTQFSSQTENDFHGKLLLISKYSKFRYSNDNYKLSFETLKQIYGDFSTQRHSYISKAVFVEIFGQEDITIKNLNEILIELNMTPHAPGISLWANKCIQKFATCIPLDMIPQFLEIITNCTEFENYSGFLLEKIVKIEKLPESITADIFRILLNFKNKYSSCVLWKMVYEISMKTETEWLKNICLNLSDIYQYLEEKQVTYKLRYMIPFAAKISVMSNEEKYLLNICRIVESLTKPDFVDVEMRLIAAIANNEFAINFNILASDVKVVVLKNAIILLQDEDEDVRMLSAQFYPKVMSLNQSFHPYHCLFQILNTSFLSTVLNKDGINTLSKELKSFLLASSSKTVDEYNPFANDTSNIYLEVNVCKQLLENLKKD